MMKKRFKLLIIILIPLILVVGWLNYHRHVSTFNSATFIEGNGTSQYNHIVAIAIPDERNVDRPNEYVYYNRVEGKEHDDYFGKCEKNSDNSVTLYNEDGTVFAYVIHLGREYKLLKDGEEISLKKIDDSICILNAEFTEWPYVETKR